MKRAKKFIPGLSIFLLIFSLITFTNHSSQANEITKPGETVTRELEHDGLTREYILHLPKSYDRKQIWPLVFVLHGGTGSAQRTLVQDSGAFITLSEREGFIAVFPNGIVDSPGGDKHHWNDGRKDLKWRAHREDVDDPGFFSAMIDYLIENFNADPDRIYVTGASNGGMMSYRLGCELSDKIAAIASLIANLSPELSSCGPGKPISVMIMNGTEDPLMPYEGGEVAFGRVRLGKVLSAAETVRFWVRRNGLSSPPVNTLEPDRDPDDNTRVRVKRYGPDKNGIEVVFYTIEGGGHTWPGGVQYLPERFIGRTSRDIDAVEVVWDFFKRHTRLGY